MAMEICKDVKPVWQEIDPGHRVACHLYDKNYQDSLTTGPQRTKEIVEEEIQS